MQSWIFWSLIFSHSGLGSYTIQGRRVLVYQPEFEECWASGLVSQHDPVSHIMEIHLDKVSDYRQHLHIPPMLC